MIKLIQWFKRKFVYDEMEDLRAFYEKFQQPMGTIPAILSKRREMERFDFMNEELLEFAAAARSGDIAGMADALIDLVYVAKGTAIEMGLPWEELWQDVQRANMAKVIGATHRGHSFDVKKPEGWIGPMTMDILREHGYGSNHHIWRPPA
jgi:predicted HAD superfamily Cof-like phosphohydrolase